MSKCWNCGADTPNSTYCPTCGKTVAPSDSQSSSYHDSPNLNRNQPGMPVPNLPMQEGRLERKINNLYKLVIVALIIEAIIFLIA